MKELKKGQYIFFFFLAVLIAFILGWLVSRITLSPTHSNITNLKQSMASKKPLYWVAPMDPNYRKNQPGKSPMGMDLVPVYNKPGSDGVITISPVIENNLGVRTTKVKKQQFHQQIHTVGYVQPNAQTLQTIRVYTEGWIKDLKVSTSGETVKKNQLLFKLY
jgi:membrane fusion protein, copper/silver efflux system